ncbi:DNA helicase [Bacteroidia bacterium]|nr:DNA helicase [Bacteroidia bacterium]
MENSKSRRIVFQEILEGKLIAKTPENQTICLHCTEIQQAELTDLASVLHKGNVLNLLNVIEIDNENWEAEFIIFEPDYLIDISSLAECFKPYGHHPLNYTLSCLQNRESTSPVLLGNTANFFIDEFVNEDVNHPAEFVTSLKKLFRTSAFEFTACEDLKNPKLEHDFFANCQKHFNNIRYAVQTFFQKAGIDKEKVVLEPSFISNALGLQGRLDIMLCDYSKFIELKSGKAVEDFRSGGQFIHSAINHYIQMILYLAVLEFNLDLKADDVDSYLLYSKYPVLSKEKHSRKHLQEAISLRNRIVAGDYALQKANDWTVTQSLLTGINSKNLNIEQLSGKLFDNYLAPNIDRFHTGFSQLSELQKTYFLRLYTFITKELWLSKAGEREYEGVKKASMLWNASLEDKLLAGELLYDLKITDNQAASEFHTISLTIPEYEDLYLPNFRPGDAVVLYERNTESDTVNNRQVFKGSIELLDGKLLKIRLRYRQKNRWVWNENAFYAIEHDYMDTTYSGMFRGLTAFIWANQDRKELLLSPPLPPPPNPLKGALESTDFQLRTMQKSPSGDLGVFLLIGPPGTGKTSIALKQMVQSEIQKNKANILLLSYTNRAVDEICKALLDISESLPFIRIGSELNCAPEFRSHLLENQLKNCTKRSEVAEVISRCRIFAGTVASVWNKPELFQLKQFDLAIVDEATQLLEPHLLGIFCVKNPSGENAVRRFVLIGDHKQLPAVVLQTKEESRVNEQVLNACGLSDLSNSLFERLYRKYKEEGRTSSYAILSKQGRMHPDIAAFPSDYFYEGLLGCVGLPHQREASNQRKRLNFYPVKPSGKELSNKTNLNEANQVVAVCKELYQSCLENKEAFQPQAIGIITPFRNQIALIRKQLQETGIDEFSNITVDTVERFQGSQRDIIIYSFCVKTESQLEALPNRLEENGKLIDRKLNVVLTRARKQLHLIGNEELLIKNPLYCQLIEHVKKSGHSFGYRLHT